MCSVAAYTPDLVSTDTLSSEIVSTLTSRALSTEHSIGVAHLSGLLVSKVLELRTVDMLLIR